MVDGGTSGPKLPMLQGVRVLLVDDDEDVRAAFSRSLGKAGAEVTTAADAPSAIAALGSGVIDVVIVDIWMPGTNGLAVLRSVREKSLDASCIILTGHPKVETAIEALRLGAFDYLNKAEAAETLHEVVAKAAAVTRLARLKREVQTVSGRSSTEPGDRLGLDIALTRTLKSLWMAYQPIVRRDGSIFGYEALMRSSDAALPHPGAILAAAERLGRLRELGQRTRTLVGSELPALAAEMLCFVNLHPSDLDDPALYEDQPLLLEHGARLVLEVTERESLDKLPDPRASVATLRKRGCRIAVDDLGAGYAGLTSFAQLEPDIVKIDMSLVRGVDEDRRKAHILGRIVELCHDLGVQVVAEGVETLGERDELLRQGCDLFQGYLIAKPAAAFPAANWPAVAGVPAGSA